MMPPYSWAVPGRNPGTSSKVTSGMLKQSQKRTKRAAFHRRVDVERAGEHCRLVGDDADGASVEAREADDDVFRVVLVHFEEVSVVDDWMDYVFDVVGLVRLGGDDLVERGVGAIGRIGAGFPWRLVEIVRRDETQQLAHHGEALGVIMCEKVRHA